MGRQVDHLRLRWPLRGGHPVGLAERIAQLVPALERYLRILATGNLGLHC